MLKNTENANTFHKQRIAETILFQPQFIPSSHPSKLSYCFSKERNHLFTTAVTSFCKTCLTATVKKYSPSPSRASP